MVTRFGFRLLGSTPGVPGSSQTLNVKGLRFGLSIELRQVKGFGVKGSP